MLTHLTLLFLTSYPFTDSVEIKGLLKGSGARETVATGVRVISPGDGKLWYSCATDTAGYFSLKVPKERKGPLELFAVGFDGDTVLIASNSSFESSVPLPVFYYPAKLYKNVIGKAKCLKCNKADKMFKIQYGDGLPVGSRRISASNDTTYSPIVKGKYNAGSCIVTTATWYCHRDKLKL